MATGQEPITMMRQSIRYSLAILLLLLTSPTYAADCPRIVSQSPYITQTLNWLGLETCIVGASRYDALEVPDTGGVMDPDAGVIATLEPEILFTSDWTQPEILDEVTPAETRAYRLQGFDSMAQIEQNLETIIEAVDRPDLEPKIRAFARQWRTATDKVNANGRRALLLSSCSGSGYSFGRNTWLYDLFTRAGFDVVESHEAIRHLRAGNEIEDVTKLLNRYHPDVLFIFERSARNSCKILMPETPVQIINLEGELFLHPAPVLLKGLERLHARRSEWYSTPSRP